MANRTKIVNASEVEHWIREGKPFRWMKEEYLRKYNVEISASTFIEYNRRHGISERYAVASRGHERPWKVLDKHRGRGMDAYLSTLIRHDNGFEVPEEKLQTALRWWKEMQEQDLVVAYHQDIGFFAVPRRPGIDKGRIREP